MNSELEGAQTIAVRIARSVRFISGCSIVVAPQLSISDADRAAFSVFFPAKRVVFIASERMECGRSGSNSKTLFGIARKVQKRRLGRELPLSALDAILKSDS